MPSAAPDGGSLVLDANRRRNDDGMWWRMPRWRHSRAQMWSLLDRHVPAGARVAIAGAGNGQDLPLRRLARRAGELWLFDLDSAALRRAKRRARRPTRVVTAELDVTFGAADEIIGAVVSGREPPTPGRPASLPGAPFDVVIADLLYTQLLYPALVDRGLPATRIDDCLRRHGRPLTDQVVRTLHASAPHGVVVHVHDLLGWWPSHPQPITPEAILALADDDLGAALREATHARPPLGGDPRDSLGSAAAEIVETSIWIWPFAPGVDYLACATVAHSAAVI